MQLQVASEALQILWQMHQAGHEIYIVGGAVRDLLLGRITKDFDFTTNALPEQIQAQFPESFYENEFGTVAIAPKHVWEQFDMTLPATTPEPKESSTKIIDIAEATKIHDSLKPALPTEVDTSPHPQLPNYEITTYRSKELYDSNYRKPDSLEWGNSLEEDLVRRDFTINALAVQIDPDWLKNITTTATQAQELITVPEEALTVIDYHQGQADLETGVISAVGDASTRFQEDALRMLRAIRFSVQLNMAISDDTFSAIATHADLIQHVSWERIRDEFFKMLASNYPAEAVELLHQTHLLNHILPELQEGIGVAQGGHHTTDVWTHSIDALRECPSSDPLIRFATLLHDIAKPRTVGTNDGQITFYNHEVVGAHLAKKIGRRFRLSKNEIDKLFILVRYHMFYYQPHNTDASIRRFMRRVGLGNLDDILDLREADRLGSGARRTSWRLEEMKQRMIEQLHQPLDVTDLAINGHDLMTQLELKPGPVLGKILNQLFEEVMENPELNTKEQLLQRSIELAEDLK